MRADRRTTTVAAARGFWFMNGAQEPDRDETYDARDAANDAHTPPRTRCRQYRDPFEEPVPRIRWAHVAGCDRSCMGEVAA